ncbi:MAG: IclR family transcriptional regulator, partial [Mesorhizobium sp.]
INDRAGRTVAAINVSTQSARFSVEAMEREILPALLSAKRRVEEFFFV